MISVEDALQMTGIKVGSLVAGFAGSIASLVANKQLTFFQSIVTVVCGVLVAGYATPAISEHFSLSRTAENCLAFFVGILGMYLVVGFIRFGEDFAKAPIVAIKNLVSLRYFMKQEDSVETKNNNDATGSKPTV